MSTTAADSIAGVVTPDARKVWLSIALHTTPNVPEFLDPEIALVTAGAETDVLGIDREALSPAALESVTAAHPRPDFKHRILRAFNDGNKHRPHSTFGNVNADVLEYSTHRSSAKISSNSSATTDGPSEMHSASTSSSSPNGDFRRVTSRSRGRPAHRMSESVDYSSLFTWQ
jgi:hypothetical protein